MIERRGGFVLTDAIATCAVLAVVAAWLCAAGGESRRLARLGDDIAKLRDLGAATTSYAADHQEVLWSFSWQGGVMYSPSPGYNYYSATDLGAQANQAVHILRTHGQVPSAITPSAFAPHFRYGHFVLAVHQNRPLPDMNFVSSADTEQLERARNPSGYCAQHPSPTATSRPADPASSWWPRLSMARQSLTESHRPHTAVASPSPARPNSAADQLAEVAFPSQKVLVSDSLARHFGACMHPTQDGARLPLLFADGSVPVRAASDANPGWQPNAPESADPSVVTLQPNVDPCAAVPIQVAGRFFWTRGTVTHNSLAGRDFDGPETCSGQPGCP